jgi:tetratricopeptide (TPR) repeat protein
MSDTQALFVSRTRNSLFGQTLGVDELTGAGRRVADNALPVGTVVNGRYTILSVLGQGGMGIVYAVSDALHPDRKLALKTMLGSGLSADALSLFRAEFKTMTSLRHPNVAAVYDFERLPGGEDLLFTMELVPGQNIFDATENAPWERVVELLVQVCRALSYVHSRKVIHFDLKPANVFVMPDGSVKVLDFGLAGAKPQTRGGGIFGTPAYMAPEMLSEAAVIDHRVDLYSLGIMAYQLLCRDVPFSATTLIELLVQQREATVRFDQNVAAPEWLKQIVLALCAKDPGDRFRSGNAVIEAINAAGERSYELETQATKESYILSSRFVGREHELDLVVSFIEERFSEAREAYKPILLVGGTGGVGKSRLMREVRQQIQLSRQTFIEADCYEGALSEFEPIVEVLRYVVRIAAATGGQVLLEKYGPDLVKIDPQLAQTHGFRARPVTNADNERMALLEQVSEFLLRVSTLVPLAIYVNDLQWARPGTTDLLAHLARFIAVREIEGQPVRLALLGSYRNDEVKGQPIERLLERLQSKGDAEIVALEPLPSSCVDALLGSMLGVDELPQVFVERVSNETAGNPFFVEEVMRSLVEKGAVYLQHGAWAANAAVGELEIPSGMAQTFRRRLAQLSAEEHDLLVCLAVARRPVAPALLETVVRLDGDRIHEILRELAQRQMVARTPGETVLYRVAHDRMRETLYADVSAERKKQLHGRFGDAIEQVYSRDLTAHLYELADHFWNAGIEAKALRYSLGGARQAKDAYAIEMAMELFERAKKLLPQDEKGTARQIAEDIADLQLLRGEFDSALSGFNAVFQELDEPMAKARVKGKIGYGYMQRTKWVAAIEELWTALELLGETRPATPEAMQAALAEAQQTHATHRRSPQEIEMAANDAERARLALVSETYVTLSMMYFYVDIGGMFLCSFLAANRAERVGKSKELALAYGTLGFQFYAVTAQFDDAMSFCEKGLDMAEELGLPWHIGDLCRLKSNVHIFLAEWEPALALAKRARALLAKHGDTFRFGIANCMVLLALWGQGKLQQARAEVDDAVQMLERVGSILAVNPVCMKCSCVKAETGETDEAIGEFDGWYDRAVQVGDYMTQYWAFLFRGIAKMAAGDMDGAITEVEEAIKRREPAFLGEHIGLRCYSVLARLHMDKVLSGAEAADVQLAKALPAVERAMELTATRPMHRAEALLARGMWLWLSGKRDEAKAFFNDAVDFAKKTKSNQTLADVHYEMGRCLSLGTAAEREDGKLALQEAVRLYTECHAMPYAARVQRLLQLRN